MKRSFSEAMLPHMDAAYTLARYLSRDPIAAEDIVQDAFLRAFRGFDRWRGDGAKAWLLTIVRNCFLNSVTAAAGRISTCDVEDWPGALPPELMTVETPDSLLLDKREARALRASIEMLPRSLREALILRELEELSYKEIADVMQVPIGTVMSRLSRARRMLSERLSAAPSRIGDGGHPILETC